VKILSVVGARPQFIKAAVLSEGLRKEHEEILVHTGQHYDREMSKVFFSELHIPKPDYNLGAGSGTHAEQTATILKRIEEVMILEQPDLVLVYGDTNSTLAAALAAVKVHMQIAHVEAGLRSFDKLMPEEINRVVTDYCSDYLYCPTQTAVKNLEREGRTKGVYKTGDVMADALYHYLPIAKERSEILKYCDVERRGYYVVTIHRPSNTDSESKLLQILQALRELDRKVVFVVHPRTDAKLTEFGLWKHLEGEGFACIPPVGYLDMLNLMNNAKKVLTDSGGMQKEAYIMGVPCITLRRNTEWVETLDGGWNTLVGSNKREIVEATLLDIKGLRKNDAFGNGCAVKCICSKLREL
jgi:UDP-N-acetylglucosamine 2-epimerase (non-hydrolysing)